MKKIIKMNYLNDLQCIAGPIKRVRSKKITLSSGGLTDFSYILGQAATGKPLPVKVTIDITPGLKKTILTSVGILAGMGVGIAAINSLGK